MVLHTSKKCIFLEPSCYLPRAATEWHFTHLVSCLDLCSFYLQPLKFTYTLSFTLKNTILPAVVTYRLWLGHYLTSLDKTLSILDSSAQHIYVFRFCCSFLTHCDLMDSFVQVEPAQTLCSLADFIGMVGRGPTNSLPLPEHHLIIAFAPLTATGFFPPTATTKLTRENKASSGF